MIAQDFKLKVPGEERGIKARLHLQDDQAKLKQLLIIATGLYSHMDKDSQINAAKSYQKAGFSTLQFNFMGHGEQQNKSDGDVKDMTISSSIKDMTTVWKYVQSTLNIEANHISISANSYGALISLLALEKRLITPESMVLVAPYSCDKLKSWALPLGLMVKLMPQTVIKALHLPVSPVMLKDFFRYHTKGMTKKDLLGSTAVHFFVGSADTIAPAKNVVKWSKTFNNQPLQNTPFVDDVQAHHIIYPGVKHFEIPPQTQRDILSRSIDFIEKTHQLRSR